MSTTYKNIDSIAEFVCVITKDNDETNIQFTSRVSAEIERIKTKVGEGWITAIEGHSTIAYIFYFDYDR